MPLNLQNSTLWLGVPNLSKDQLKNFDPAYTGYVHIFVIRTPQALVQHDKEFGTYHAANFKAIFERTSTSVNGLPELTVNYQDQVHGFADRKVPHATAIESNMDTLTIRCLEFKGIPAYNMLETWLYLVGGDEVSKIKDYKGMAGRMPGGYSLENHTASFIIINSTPDLTDIVGRAHYITVASPTNLSRDIYNTNPGEIGIIEGHDISMKGVLRWGAEVDTKARELLANRKSVINYYAGRHLYSETGQVTATGAYTVKDSPFHTGGSLNGETIPAQTGFM